MEMVKRKEGRWRRRKTVRKCEGKGKRERNQRVLSELLGFDVWDPRSVQIPRLRIESLNSVTGVKQADRRGVGQSDGRHKRWRARRKRTRRSSTRCDQQTVGMDDGRHISWRSTRRWLFENRCWLTETPLGDWTYWETSYLKNLLKEIAINGLPPIQRFVLCRKLDRSG